jgi:hypothetical protein
MDPFDATGATIQSRCAETSDRWCGKPISTVIAFGLPLIPVPAQSERPCRDSDALIGSWCRLGRDGLAYVTERSHAWSADRMAIT